MDAPLHNYQFRSLSPNWNGLSYLVQLPDYEVVYQDVYDLSWPQITAYSTAVIGIILVVLFIAAIRG